MGELNSGGSERGGAQGGGGGGAERFRSEGRGGGANSEALPHASALAMPASLGLRRPTKKKGSAPRPEARGLHSSTIQLNLSRV